MPEHAWALVILGVLAGMLSGMFGIGGGVIIVPALSVLLGYALETAIGTSLGVLIWPVSFFAVLAYYRAGLLNIGVAALIAIGLVGGGVVGAQIALNLPGETLQRIYGIFLIYVGWRFIEPRKLWATRRASGPPAAPNPAANNPPDTPWYVLLAVGLGAGVTSGLFGIGGGLVIVPALTYLFEAQGFPREAGIRLALGTSLATILFTSLSSARAHHRNGFVDWSLVKRISPGILVGTYLGGVVAARVDGTVLKGVFTVFLVLVALQILSGAKPRPTRTLPGVPGTTGVGLAIGAHLELGRHRRRFAFRAFYDLLQCAGERSHRDFGGDWRGDCGGRLSRLCGFGLECAGPACWQSGLCLPAGLGRYRAGQFPHGQGRRGRCAPPARASAQEMLCGSLNPARQQNAAGADLIAPPPNPPPEREREQIPDSLQDSLALACNLNRLLSMRGRAGDIGIGHNFDNDWLPPPLAGEGWGEGRAAMPFT